MEKIIKMVADLYFENKRLAEDLCNAQDDIARLEKCFNDSRGLVKGYVTIDAACEEFSRFLSKLCDRFSSELNVVTHIHTNMNNWEKAFRSYLSEKTA